MKSQKVVLRDAAVGVAVVDQPEALSSFFKPGCAAAIWRRQLLPEFQSWIDQLAPENLPSGRVILRPDDVADTVRQLCDIAQASWHETSEHFVEDVAALAQIFSRLMNVEYIRLRLEAVNTNACRKFHIDAVTARLVCTYRGTGTQYGISTDGHDPRRVFTVPTAAPILLRGTLWPDDPPSGLLHRSPLIEGTGETRLVLVLDPVFDPQDVF